jgi:cholestenol delta-isomerase
MEGVTAFLVGPLCAAAAWAYTAGAAWRHVAALIASVCQLYGDALYFGTAAFEGMVHTRVEPLYFWFYFVVLNGVWVVGPGAVVVHTVREIVRACGGAGAGAVGGRRRR